MKITSTILCDFVNDFKLEVTDMGVCFDAIINFNLPMQNFNVQSEVYMESVLSRQVDTICLLNPAVEKYYMPTVLNDVNYNFLYLKRRGLLITGSMPMLGAYTISIFPQRSYCSQETYYELRAKKLN